jgi:hypothetical protein
MTQLKQSEAELQRIEKAVAAAFGLRVFELRTTCREKTVMWPKQLCVYAMAKGTKIPYGFIADYIHRDRSTVTYTVEVVEGYVSGNARLARQLQDVMRQVFGATNRKEPTNDQSNPSIQQQWEALQLPGRGAIGGADRPYPGR